MKRSVHLVGLVPLVGSFAILACAQAPADLQEISLERTTCYGTCPAYEVTLRSDGTLTYTGKMFVKRLGSYRATFSKTEFSKLASLAKKLKLWSLKESYSISASDLPSQNLILKSMAGTKKIDEYGPTGPKGLSAFHRAIDGVVEGAKDWQKVK